MGLSGCKAAGPDGAWVDEIDAVAIAFVHGQQLDALKDLLRLRPSTRREASFHEAETQQDYDRSEFVVQLDESNGWTVLVEPNGYLTSIPEAATALSAQGQVVSVYWNVNAQMQSCWRRTGLS